METDAKILEASSSENGETFGIWRSLGLKCACGHFRVQYLAPVQCAEDNEHLLVFEKMGVFQKELCVHTNVKIYFRI